jgi:tRNA nucleotidyltransferase (CCA-adding enzyme)
MITIKIPKQVNEILDKLHDSGYEAYIVGGCVRDAVLGRMPHDWDITTSAEPDEVKALFERTIDTGLKHGTVTVMSGKTGYEITTFRVDGDYSDGRHPHSVAFTKDIIKDL